MSAGNKLLGGRYQFIQVLGASEAGQTLLVADVHYPGHPKCVLRQMRLPTRNPMTLKFILSLLKKKAEVLEVIGQHQQIPSTFASFDSDQNFYLVQEFIPGRSLQDTLMPGKPLPEPAVLALLKEALVPIAFAQEHGVVHGSLKPAKMIRHQTDNRLVLIDFGHIKNISQEVSSKEVSQVSPKRLSQGRPYLAPEQRQGKPARFCSDHYALGMIAIQALTGLPAEELPNPDHPNSHQDIVSLLQDLPDLGLHTASVLTRMVHPNPDRRYQKAVEILADLKRLSGVQPPVSTATDDSAFLKAEFPLEYASPKPRQKIPWISIGGASLALLALFTGMMTLRLPQRLLSAQSMRQAQADEEAGDLDRAIAHYTQALKQSPDNIQALVQRSQLHLQTGNTEAALADITQAIELQPGDPILSYERGNIRFSVGDVQGAIEDYTQAIRQDPTFARAYVNRGSARANWSDDQGAVEDYTQAIDLDPPTETQAAAYLNRCFSYSNLGEQVLALEDCSMAINLRPSHSLAYQNRGLVRRRLGDLQGSLQDYNIAIQIDPDSPDPYFNRGLSRQAMNDLTGAMDDFSKAIALDPDYVFALYNRGLLHMELGQRSQALADFQQASQRCLELGRTGCYEDAQFQISRLQTEVGSDE